MYATIKTLALFTLLASSVVAEFNFTDVQQCGVITCAAGDVCSEDRQCISEIDFCQDSLKRYGTISSYVYRHLCLTDHAWPNLSPFKQGCDILSDSIECTCGSFVSSPPMYVNGELLHYKAKVRPFN